MNPTKLSHLEKPGLLSVWQQQQIEKMHTNDSFFIKPEEIDPWKNEQREMEILKTQIPSLKSVGQWNPRHRYNKDINQTLKSNKIINSNYQFNNNKK